MFLPVGGVIGLVCSVCGMLAYGSTYERGLSDFFTNTAQDYSLLTGLLSGFISSILVSIIVSLCDRKSKERMKLNKDYRLKPEDKGEDKVMDDVLVDLEIEWMKTMSIDNPLNPCRSLYKKELNEINAGKILTVHHMETIFRRTRLFSIIGVVISFAVFLVIVPAIAVSQEVLSQAQLGIWISVCQHWCLIATVFVIMIPPIQEGVQIWRQYKKNKELINEERDEVSLEVASET